jgi:ABC-type uncharacterized transport system involved in gliding motility auxiliary subunit
MLTGAGLLVALVLLFAINIFTGTVFTSARMDLTENKLFTLSEGTRSTLEGLEEPITLRFYVSERLVTAFPAVNSYAIRVKGILGEFERLSGGKVNVHVIDPEPFSEAEDRAVGYGLRGVPLEGGEETLYFGLVGTNSTDDEDVIPFLTTRRESFIEYDITRLIHNLANPEQPVVGLLSSLPVDGAGPQAALRGLTAPPWMVTEQVQEIFQLERVESTAKEIPEEMSVVMVVHPKGLGDATLYAIDQFVLRGGRVLVFVDPHSAADQGAPQPGMPMMPASRSSNLGKLLPHWGLQFDPGQVVGDLQLAAKVRTQQGGRLLTIDYPVWLNVVPDYFDRDDTVTAELGNVTYATPGHLEPIDGASTRFIPLMRTTENAALFEAQRFLDPSADPRGLLRDYQPAGRSFVLAARIVGPATSAFPDGPPGDAPAAGETQAGGGSEAGKQHLGASESDINVVVVADTDLLQDRFWVQVQEFLGNRIAVPSAANGVFVVNALDNLTGSNDLISVRNRGSFIRPFERVNALRQEAELEFRQKEQELMQRLEQTEARLLELEQAKQGEDSMILSPEQRQAIVRFREEKLAIRTDLRDVRLNLRKDIDALDTWLKFINIALVPLLIGVGGALAGVWRLRRRKSALGVATG